jgi:hypothetical protein
VGAPRRLQPPPIERSFVEERQRLKIVPNSLGEKPVMKLMFGALIRAAERWRGLRFTEFELVNSQRYARNSTRNIRLQSCRRHGRPNRAFPANRRPDLAKGDVFIDIEANRCKKIRELGARHVVSFEPRSDLFRNMERSVCEIALDQYVTL